ncbi:dTDP-4-dehydrorhamnose reductase [Henriciella marina]|uniref:dTDP-4-dehydrorhamnose reductase n=1 Tax=Henriciella marina TaxID=453851 RepID=UPI00037C89E5|nr:dTDP-4-dehydrorhamnose reductase [Henriciella marina]
MTFKILVCGSQGQVAQALAESHLPDDISLTARGRPDLDLLDAASIRQSLTDIQPDLVVNAAAYTAVDQAETEIEAAHALNAAAPGELARQTAALGVPLIHLSTDYVFDGSKDAPYTEEDPVNPLGVYGRTKREGEIAVIEANPNSIVMRTAWVYSPFGKNFCKTMLRVSEQRDALGVVMNQLGNPTAAHDIASAIIAVSKTILVERQPVQHSIYHLSGTGEASWADFASAIFEHSASIGGPTAKVKRITSAEFPTPVKRPSNSRLDCRKLEQAYGIEMPHWRESMRACVNRLVETGAWKT